MDQREVLIPQSLPVCEDTVDSSNTVASIPKENRSTGPKGIVGKRISSRNALKHGAFSQEVIREHLLDRKDRKKYREVLEGLLDDYNPVGQAELFQVELMATYMHKYKCVLRLSRALRGNATRDVVQELFTNGSYSELFEKWRLDIAPLEILEKLNRAENHSLHQYNRAAAELERLQRMRLGDDMLPRITLDVNT